MAKRKNQPHSGGTPPTLRGRVWAEIDGEAAITEAGADLLEQIEEDCMIEEPTGFFDFEDDDCDQYPYDELTPELMSLFDTEPPDPRFVYARQGDA